MLAERRRRTRQFGTANLLLRKAPRRRLQRNCSQPGIVGVSLIILHSPFESCPCVELLSFKVSSHFCHVFVAPYFTVLLVANPFIILNFIFGS